MNQERRHRHHLIPKHMGGLDEEDNLTPPISIALHAEFHRVLYEDFGKAEDNIAWKALSGRITSEEARLEAAIVGQEKSEKYKNRKLGDHLARVKTKESCSKGGKAAAPSLVRWIEENMDTHRNRCRELGKTSGERQKIPHEFNGIAYPSKKELQDATGISNCGFYGKLKRGEINRLVAELDGK